MNKMTYKEFEKIISDMGYFIEPGYVVNVMVTTNEGAPLLSISKSVYKSLNLSWIAFDELPDDEREILADASWALASTPLKDREEPKKYYLKVNPKYNPLFSHGGYLNRHREHFNMIIKDNYETEYWQTQFTEDECRILEKKYDLSILERVEVEDE